MGSGGWAEEKGMSEPGGASEEKLFALIPFGLWSKKNEA
jgi:hypothetical protein